MESRSSSRRFGAPAAEMASHFTTPREPSKYRTRAGASRGCSFILLLQICLALLCCSFVFQWWNMASSEDRHVNLRGGPDQEQQSHSPRPFRPHDGAQEEEMHHDVADQEHASHTIAPPPAVLEKAAHTTPAESSAFRYSDSAARAFVPPTSTASAEEIAEWRERFHPSKHTADQRKVAAMVAWAWKGYEERAFGQDYLNVQTMKGDGLPGHDMAITLVDSLDTLFLLGMFDQFDRATEWVGKNMKDRIYQSGFISLFETTIRNMGGLLSAYYLSGQKQLLQAAKDLGEALSPAFTIRSHGIPGKDFDVMAKHHRDMSSVAEAGSLQLEFKYLAQATGERKYFDQVERIMDSLFDEVHKTYKDGLLPVHMSGATGKIVHSKITLGANGDSYYEYLLKQWLQSGKKDTKYKTEYMRAVDGIRAKLVAKSRPNGLVFIGELVQGRLSPKMDHLVCFVPGMLTLGYMHGMPEEHLELAKQLIETCYQMYDQMAAKLAPEIAYFNMNEDAKTDLDIHPQDAFNLQRPETVESLMLLYRATKDDKYREYGRQIMAAFEQHCKLPEGGYTTISNIAVGPIRSKFRDGMESFFLAETLKYLFLLFSDDESLLPLDEVVFNTEAHPFPIVQ